MLYTALSSVTSTIVSKFGRDVTLTRKTIGSYDPTTGTNYTTATTTIRGVVSSYRTRDLSENIVQMGDVPFYTATEITKDDQITIGSIKYAITAVAKHSVEASDVLFEANLRRL